MYGVSMRPKLGNSAFDNIITGQISRALIPLQILTSQIKAGRVVVVAATAYENGTISFESGVLHQDPRRGYCFDNQGEMTALSGWCLVKVLEITQ